MKLLRVGFVLIIAILSSLRGVVKSSEPECYNPDKLLSYLDFDLYNISNPFVDYESVVNPILDAMLGRNPHVMEPLQDLFMCWDQVCDAEDPEKANVAWKSLAQEINHRLHTDESVSKVAKIIFGDRMVSWIMNPPDSLFMSETSRQKDCMHRLTSIFVQNCGKWNNFGLKYVGSFYAMCLLGVNDDEFTHAAQETCRGYVYIPNPLLY